MVCEVNPSRSCDRGNESGLVHDERRRFYGIAAVRVGKNAKNADAETLSFAADHGFRVYFICRVRPVIVVECGRRDGIVTVSLDGRRTSVPHKKRNGSCDEASAIRSSRSIAQQRIQTRFRSRARRAFCLRGPDD